MVASRTLRQIEFPQIHKIHKNFQLSADDASRTASATIIPLVVADEAQIASSKSTNPRNGAFAPMIDNPNCCPQSRINRISGQVTFDLTQFAWSSDKIRNMKVVTIPIAVSFEDLEVVDEKTTTSIKAILELQSEATDRQTYPIYNDDVIIGSKIDMSSAQLGLTATTALEGVTFDYQQLFDALSYYTNGPKLSSCIGKIQTNTVTIGASPTGQAAGQTVKFNIKMPDKVKRMNPFSFFGLLFYIPQLGIESQYGIASDTNPGEHVHVDLRANYLEWNGNFQMDQTTA